MASEEIKRLRAQVRARHAAATKKVSRLRNVNGVEIGGTEFDVRRPPARTKNYNSAQLQRYLTELESFMSRGNNFVAGFQGMPIRKQTLSEYRRVEARNNRKAQQLDDLTGDVRVFPKGITVRERRENVMPEGVRAAGAATNKPFFKLSRNVKGIHGEAALQKILKTMQGKMRPEFLSFTVKAQRMQMSQMLDRIGDPNLSGMAGKLTDEQFYILWNEYGLADRLAEKYEIAKGKANGRKERRDESVSESNLNYVENLIGSALLLKIEIAPIKKSQGKLRG